MNKTSFQVQAFLDNDSETFSYVVYENDGNLAVIIDPVLEFDAKSGRTSTVGAEAILAFVKSKNLTVPWILETHAHADHLSAAPYLRDNLNAKIGIGSQITQVQKTFKAIFNLEKEFLPNGSHFDALFDDGDEFTVGSLTFKVIHTPGHTPADLTYLVNNEAMFVGDTLFMPDVGTARCDFPGGSAHTLYQSITALLSYPTDTKIYICHDYPPEGREHEYVTTVAEQRSKNKHVRDGISEAEFVRMREERDATLSMPKLILPAIQVNIRAGKMPPAEDNGTIYLKIPLNQL
ncbi:MBL fold metallo-hydrolase [Aliidiomarina shirensis]|uniref:MBL fold metallo-hydrolase n=1 Tax=Aliidiomarina shirensis TaxID=1048642 RepID=A0A432WXK7_9GAMM|nr:MBL fold metallo-hydrolase [Aliidiomarina shirensis]RUO38503.1 MBL fold metallo-hydrolase [Aliidiomarina shirensis]